MVCCFSSTETPIVSRDASLWPFSSTSAFNTPIGSDAVFVDHPLLRSVTWVFNGPGPAWSVPIALYDIANPLVNISQSNQCNEGSSFTALNLRIPSGMTGADPQICYRDGMLCVLSDDGYAYGFNQFRRTSDTTGLAAYHQRYNFDHLITGDGYNPTAGLWIKGHWIAGVSLIAGVIRKWEVDAIAADSLPYMRHALQIALPDVILRAAGGGGQSTTYRWPATFSDGGWANYSGTVWIGSLLAIPPTFNIDAQLWNEPAKVLARTLQKFGGYPVARAGTANIMVETGALQAPITQMNQHLYAIRNELRLVDNNTPTTVGGGGNYPSELWPLPPPVLP